MNVRDEVFFYADAAFIDRTAKDAREKALPALKEISERKMVYTLKERLKGIDGILSKVYRKQEANGETRFDEKYTPLNVTDAWACRFVTLMP